VPDVLPRRAVYACMQKLLLAHNDLRGFLGAGCVPKWVRHLTELDLSGNCLSAVPWELAAATALRQLHMGQQYRDR
jgi:hypothetical protein